MNAAVVLGVHGGETDMGIYCTFQLSGGDRPSDSAGVFLRRGTLLSFFFCPLGASSSLSSVGLV
ncbi:hypothetical protein NC652_034362 [Populus alba x Populus x berolinensis]|nr:hypothetical protein NC652_034362 [Populus alba x Populus x berolinensis]